jgi:hypothetical protein
MMLPNLVDDFLHEATMSTITASNCRFCSAVSKANGEDPIGSADTFDQWLILETPLPWAKTIWMQPDPIPPDVHEALAPVWDLNFRFRPLAIAPDSAYSQPGYKRVLYFRRPAAPFAQLEKQEYLLPSDAVASLVTALFLQPETLPRFAPYRQHTDHIRDLLVCTHGNVDAACARFGYPIYRQLRQQYASDRLRVWRVSHFGYHQFAPTLLDLPEGRLWGHLETSMLHQFIHRNESVAKLRSFYQGWAVLTKFEQIAERALFIQEGWKWLQYLKTSKVLAVDPNEQWADVRITFIQNQTKQVYCYDIKIEACGYVTTAWWTSPWEDEEPLESVKQYRASQITQVDEPK